MKNIASALVKAQTAFGPALKTSTNPHFKSRYADLSACIEAVIDSLNANGIFLAQPTHEDATGVTVETLFIHESGETLSCGKLHVPASKQDPQGYGSALTYARRYSLMAACGIAPEDDDGNAATKSKEPKAVKIIPTPDIELSEREMNQVNELALEIVEAWARGSEIEVLDLYYKSQIENEQVIALWKALGPHSKIRAFIKANSPTKAKEPA